MNSAILRFTARCAHLDDAIELHEHQAACIQNIATGIQSGNNATSEHNVERSIKYLVEVCKGGRFGSTHSTVLAIKAIVAYDASRAVPRAPGSVQLVVDGKPVGEPVPFNVDTHGAIELPDASTLFTPGKHTVSLKMADGSPMPYSVTVDYHNLTAVWLLWPIPSDNRADRRLPRERYPSCSDPQGAEAA
jgi:hypothetical protein